MPDHAALWEGFSGSAVLDDHERLVALVAKTRPDRQRRRLLVVPVEVVADEPDFVSAAAAVGGDSHVEDCQAPVWRRSVDPQVLTVVGIPARVADAEQLRAVGVHAPSRQADGSYLDQLERDKDTELDAALAKACQGGRRIVLVVGDSAAGKSRSAYEAVRRDPVLRHWRLVVPLSDGGLSRLVDADPGWQDTVVWLDDLDKHLSWGRPTRSSEQRKCKQLQVHVFGPRATSRFWNRSSRPQR